MQEEIRILNENELWFLVKAPYGKITVPGKWVVKIERIEHEVAGKYMARFVAKGFGQTEGVDFGETFAPTSRPETFILVMTKAAQHNLHLKQLDVKSGFLREKIKEKVFTEQPKDFAKVAKDGSNQVSELNKVIYGIKQASKNWYDRRKNFLLDENFKQSKNDFCIHVKFEGTSLMYVREWVDDILVASSDLQ